MNRCAFVHLPSNGPHVRLSLAVQGLKGRDW